MPKGKVHDDPDTTGPVINMPAGISEEQWYVAQSIHRHCFLFDTHTLPSFSLSFSPFIVSGTMISVAQLCREPQQVASRVVCSQCRCSAACLFLPIESKDMNHNFFGFALFPSDGPKSMNKTSCIAEMHAPSNAHPLRCPPQVLLEYTVRERKITKTKDVRK